MSRPVPRRTPFRRPLLLLLGGVALLPAGCLDFEKQTLVAAFNPARDEAHLLVLSEGLQAPGDKEDDLKSAKKTFDALYLKNAGVLLGHPMGLFQLVPEEGKQLTEKEQQILALIRKHLTVRRGTFFIDGEGRLCGAQVISIREARQFVRTVNGMISEVVAADAEKALGDTTKRGGVDEATLRLQLQAARERHAWIHFEPGRVGVSLVGSPKYFAEMKKKMGRDLFLRDLQNLLPKKPAPGQAPPPRDLAGVDRALAYFVEQGERWVAAAAETPWNVEHRRHRLTATLGVGDGEPIRTFSPYVPEEKGVQAAALVEHAKKQGVELKKGATAESVIADFLRQHAAPKK